VLFTYLLFALLISSPWSSLCLFQSLVVVLLTQKQLMSKPKAPAWAALHRAAAEGDATAAKQLLLAGAAVNAADKKGRTALHRAAKHGHAAEVQLLLGQQAAVNAVDTKGRTALHTARSKAVVQALLGAGAAVDAADAVG
jgi:ankyrin repeat protein